MDLPNNNAYPIGIISQYREYLKSSGFSNPTVKNYLSDLRHLFIWLSSTHGEFKLVQINESSLRSYRSFLKEKFRSKPSIAARRLSSLRKFLSWAANKGLVTPQLVKAVAPVLEPLEKGISTVVESSSTEVNKQPPPLPDKLYRKVIHHIKHTRPTWYHHYHRNDWTSTFHTVILILLTIVVGTLVFYTEIIQPQLEEAKESVDQQLGDVLAATSPPSVLSFQGRLTDSSDVAVTSATDIVFKIYDAETSGSLLWTSKTWAVTPDQNGIFSVCLGNQDTTDDCLINGVADTAFPATLFTDNPALYLQVEVETEVLSPRQRISSVAYAMNSDALEGFHGSQSPGANQVPVLNSSGNLIFAGAATIGTGGAGAFTLDSDSGTILFGAGTNTLVNTDGSTALLFDATGDLQFQTTSNYITSSGDLVIAGTLTVNGASTVIGSGGNTFTFDTSTGPDFAGTARPAKIATLSPEYAGASLTTFYGAGTDTNITGNMTSDVETTASNSLRTYYQWERTTDATLHYYTVAVRVTLPSDFSAWQTSNALQVEFVTDTTGTTANVLDVRVYLESDSTTAVASSTGNASSTADTWSTVTIDDSVLDDASAPEWDAAGETAVIYLRMGSASSEHVRIGDIFLNYLAKF